MHIGFWLGDLKERDHLEDPCIDGRTILKGIFKQRDGVLRNGLMSLRIRTLGAALVNGVMNIRVPQYAGNFLTS